MTAPRFLADEHISPALVQATCDYDSSIDFARIQELGLTSTSDQDLLEFAWQERRVLVSHDVNTMPHHAFVRLENGLSVAGVLLAPAKYAVSVIAESLATVALASEAEEWIDQVRYLPL